MKNIFRICIIAFLFIATSFSVNAAIVYNLDNSCGTSQLVVLVIPDINYSGGQAVWSPAVFTISWPMALGTGALGTISNQNGFSFATAGALGNDGTNYYQKYAHTGSPTLVMTAGTSYEVTRIAMVGSVGTFGNFEIPASTNAWVIANNGFSVFSNSAGNQVVSPYTAVSLTNIPLFAGIFWDGFSWCGGSGTGEQPGAPDGALTCYVNGMGAQLTTPVVTPAVVNALTINTSSQLTIMPGAALTNNGTTTINSANGLVMASNNTATGSFIPADLTTITYGGGASASVQAYLKNVAGPGNFHIHLVGPMVKDPAYSAGGTGVYLSAFNILGGGTYAYRYNEPTNVWMNIYQLTDPIPTTAGVSISDVSGTSKVLSMSGELIQPQVLDPTIAPWDPTITAGQGNGVYLFSNPFPSAMDLDPFYLDNVSVNRLGGNFFFWVWDDETSTYGVWDADSPIGTGNMEFTNGYINPGQGFFAQLAGTASQIRFRQQIRGHYSGPFLKSDPINLLRISASGNFSSDDIIIRFRENVNSGYDINDAEKWASMPEKGATEISTITNDNYFLTINSLPPLEAGQMVSVPMTFTCGAEDTYTINARNLESFELGTEIWLEDIMLGGEWHSLVENPVYQFTAAQGDPENRFVVHFFSTTGIGDDPQDEITSVQIYGYGQDAYIVNRGNETIKEYVAYDMMGRELHRGTLPDNTVNKVWVSNVSGYYIMKVITKEGRIYTEKVYATK